MRIRATFRKGNQEISASMVGTEAEFYATIGYLTDCGWVIILEMETAAASPTREWGDMSDELEPGDR